MAATPRRVVQTRNPSRDEGVTIPMLVQPTAAHLILHGHRIAYRIAGRGPVVVLVHGMAGSALTWRHAMPALADHYTVVAPDLLGHGESAKPRGDYSLGAHASLLRDLLNALGHERATFVGQSLGGGIVLQFAYQFPERCERIVLVGSGGLGTEVHAVLRALTAPFAESLFSFVCTGTLRDAAASLGGILGRWGLRLSPAGEEVWRSYASLAREEDRGAFFRTLRSVVDLGGQAIHAGDRLYLAAHMPTMIVWGDRDPFIPHHHGSTTHAAIPGSRLEIFPGCGHFPHCEDPARFVAVVRDFIESTAAAAMSERLWREQFRATLPIATGAGASAISAGKADR
jgi:pimeloyl-ACP methyl ester carboxylesterase